MNKISPSPAEAVRGIKNGATILCSGFGDAGCPFELLNALAELDLKDLTLVSNNVGSGDSGIPRLLRKGAVRKIICSYPRTAGPSIFDDLYKAGDIELELAPQGTLAERIRAAGAGIGGFYTPTAAGTVLAERKEVRSINGRDHILEWPIKADAALVKAECADPWGNVIYRKAARNFGPVMCMAADLVIVQVKQVVAIGELDPEHIVTPGIFVDRITAVSEPAGPQSEPYQT